MRSTRAVLAAFLSMLAVTTLPADALAATSAPAAASATARPYEGTVVAVDRAARTFRLRDSERGTVTIRVTRATGFERIAGFRALRRGLTNIESTVRRSDGRWIAVEVERSGGGGAHGDGGGDDRGRGGDD